MLIFCFVRVFFSSSKVVALYQELRKALIGPTTSNQTNTRRGSVGQGNSGGGDSAQMFAEMAGKSTYLSQIKADVLMHGDFINEVTSSINSLKATDMDGLSSFVFKVDHALESILTDERAVLKHFPKWPEAKFDTMREASGMHMELVAVKDMNWQCGGEPVEVECSKIGAYFEKCAKTIDGHQISLEKSKAKVSFLFHLHSIFSSLSSYLNLFFLASSSSRNMGSLGTAR